MIWRTLAALIFVLWPVLTAPCAVHRGPTPSAATAAIPQTGALMRQMDNTGIAGADGAALTSWSAVVGNAMTGTATVKTGANGLNSLPVALFNGTSDRLFGTQSGQTAQPVTLAIVFQFQATGGNHTLAFSGAIHIWELSGNINGAAGINIDTGVTVDTSWHKLVMVFNGASSTYSFDGAAPTTFGGTPGSGQYASDGAFTETLGAFFNDPGNAFYSNIKIAAYYAWNIGLSSGEQTQWSSYITSHYGL